MSGTSTDARTGSAATKLVIIRGNSAAGKSTIARHLQLGYGRGCALIEQDYLRRKILRELDTPGGIAPDFIDHTARFALDHGYHVIIEGILHRERYAPMLKGLRAGHAGQTSVFYLDVSFEESVRRHTTRPQVTDFTPAQMKDWYICRDLLGYDDEHLIAESSSQRETVDFIARTAGLSRVPI
jgi:predicted kinase